MYCKKGSEIVLTSWVIVNFNNNVIIKLDVPFFCSREVGHTLYDFSEYFGPEKGIFYKIPFI